MRTAREVAVFVVRDGRHLVLRRAGSGIWHVVAGVVEEGESYSAAGLRELREETGLALHDLPYDLGSQVHGIDEQWRHEFPSGQQTVTVHSFGVEATAAWEPTLNEEHVAYRWCDLDEACGLLHWKEAREMVRKLTMLVPRRSAEPAMLRRDGQRLLLRRATEADVPELRRLVNGAYRVLGEMGLNYTGVTQDESVTRERMRRGEVYLLESEGQLVGTIKIELKRTADRVAHAYVSQLAVEPGHQRHGLGRRLMAFAEERTLQLGVGRVRLDTAIPATHLVRWYAGLGYTKVGEVQWPGKTYRSVVLEKVVRRAGEALDEVRTE